MEIITISAVKVWPDGGVSIKDNRERWLKPGKGVSGVDWNSLQGQNIMVDVRPWTNPNSGKVTNYINDWQPADGRQPIPAGVQVAYNAEVEAARPASFNPGAPAANQAQPVSQPAGVDRDASIVAQALCKALQNDTCSIAWENYVDIYHYYESWKQAGCPANAFPRKPQSDGGQSNDRPDPTEQHGHPALGPGLAPEFDDDIPF